MTLRDELQARIDRDNPAELLFLIWVRALGPLLVTSNDPADDRAADGHSAGHDRRHDPARLPRQAGRRARRLGGEDR